VAYTAQTWQDNSTAHPVSAARMGVLEQGVADAHRFQDGTVALESFAGATDDDKLTAALAYSQAQTYKPPIGLLENRVYSFATPRTLASGMKIVGGAGFSNQYRGALSTPQRVDINVSGGGAWLRMPSSGQVFDVEISRLSFYSQSSTTDFLGGGGGVLWTSVIRDVGFSLFRHVLGSPSAKLLNTVLQLDGWWNINNGRGVSCTLGGSDSTFWPQGCLLDSPTSNTSGGGVPYHLWFDYQEKSNVGPMFITAEGIPAGVRITGNDSTGALVFHSGTRIEGRNLNQPSNGSVVRMEGGRVTFRDAWLSYGYGNPGSSGRTGEGGVVSVLGGRALFDGCWYSRAGGTPAVAETVPWIYASGSTTKVRVQNAEVAHDGGTWTGLPRVQAANGATVTADDTVTVI